MTSMPSDSDLKASYEERLREKDQEIEVLKSRIEALEKELKEIRDMMRYHP